MNSTIVDTQLCIIDSSLSGTGCDFVVATTQAISINKGLLNFLKAESQPVQYLCFLQDDHGYITKLISLDDPLIRTKGVNPFYIPAGTDPNDPRLLALDDAEFGGRYRHADGYPTRLLACHSTSNQQPPKRGSEYSLQPVLQAGSIPLSRLNMDAGVALSGMSSSSHLARLDQLKCW